MQFPGVSALSSGASWSENLSHFITWGRIINNFWMNGKQNYQIKSFLSKVPLMVLNISSFFHFRFLPYWGTKSRRYASEHCRPSKFPVLRTNESLTCAKTSNLVHCLDDFKWSTFVINYDRKYSLFRTCAPSLMLRSVYGIIT